MRSHSVSSLVVRLNQIRDGLVELCFRRPVIYQVFLARGGKKTDMFIEIPSKTASPPLLVASGSPAPCLLRLDNAAMSRFLWYLLLLIIISY